MFNLDSYVVLWSPTQQVVDVDSVGEMIRKNQMHFNNKMKTDFIVLGIYSTKQQAKVEASKIQALRDKIYS
ncbi:hypothetical protein GA076_23930 [Vibrio parahaemolyticus]|uniref:hypothetical protein n=1 Tax=Vibrio parahaemolyticus TaxID=670 RepID=UPI0006A6AEF9|nr:hypothetical protein [Vibrio parahaemolyticus]EGQ9060159.1 hypothetical protein [Vibrio parahaemolyticus]EGU9031282.1 hypothetical protein [Vibrio parahaemolyticus]EHR0760647.1 hypothetical protein [Vibrio parahaemolyticus]EHR0831341.1 hypothetical protein [Vibrio parahaemolyticus]EHR1160531.1 hypothetical protein [Vibrio parahaemolyticus]